MKQNQRNNCKMAKLAKEKMTGEQPRIEGKRKSEYREYREYRENCEYREHLEYREYR